MRLQDERCYRALRARDARFDGRFFVAVRTTGVYCRPICPAPAARRANLRFFGSAAAAEEAGFRPCRRCRPETAPGSPPWAGPSVTVERALRLIDEGALDETGVDALAARLGIGDHHLRRLFLRHVGATPLTVARTRRAHFARRLVDETGLPMTQVAFAAGFRSLRQFNQVLRETFGAAPSALRRKASPHGGGNEGLGLRLSVRPPFDPGIVMDFLRPRATPGVEAVEGATYSRLLRLPGGPAVVEIEPSPEGRTVTLRLSRALGRGLVALVARARRLLDLDADTGVVHAHLRRDPVLARRLPKAAALHVPGTLDPWELAVRAVLGQQISVAAARTLAGRLVTRFGERVAAADALTHLFPSPDRLVEADLRAIGLTTARAETLRALARSVADGRLSLEAGAQPEETRAALLALPGVGPWTVEYVALRALGDPDAFPASDLGLRQAASDGPGPLGAAELGRRAEAWRPWRAYAAIALWHSLARSREAGERTAR
jgi:AraC family transcriptional regulator of adaptative response / DNA-3-methyladenine glycosylase II